MSPPSSPCTSPDVPPLPRAAFPPVGRHVARPDRAPRPCVPRRASCGVSSPVGRCRPISDQHPATREGAQPRPIPAKRAARGALARPVARSRRNRALLAVHVRGNPRRNAACGVPAVRPARCPSRPCAVLLCAVPCVLWRVRSIEQPPRPCTSPSVRRVVRPVACRDSSSNRRADHGRATRHHVPISGERPRPVTREGAQPSAPVVVSKMETTCRRSLSTVRRARCRTIRPMPL